ncbi:hypothetical protein [Halomonas salifodinae]|uniref:hypothetical protein n=1 Tax=Halomonas salifodinae TaxID=438745 RepID=UPI0033A51B63
MSPEQHQQVIDRLEAVIRETQETLARFEATGMETELPADYDKLLEILDSAVKSQRAHTLAMLG